MNRFLTAAVGLPMLAAGVALLGGCADVTPAAYRNQTPTLALERYFNGPLSADGLVFNRAGKVVKRFHVDMVGRWSGDEGTLTEHFSYADGSKSERIWHLRRLPGADGQRRYEGRAADVVGTARGYAEGNAFNWHYTLALPVDGSTYQMQMDDWMYLMNDHVLLNRTEMRKFGIRFASIVIAFHKP
jgi:hypothetical protein